MTEYPWEHHTTPSDKEQLWWRATGPIGDDPLLHSAILTFASDLTLVDTILQRHGRTPFDEHFVGASLDHSLWFHRPFRADEWIFYDQTSPDRLRRQGARARPAVLAVRGRRRQRRPGGARPVESAPLTRISRRPAGHVSSWDRAARTGAVSRPAW